MKITRQELMDRVAPRVGGSLASCVGVASDKLPMLSPVLRERALVVETARALGYEVLEEPELPERLRPIFHWPSSPANIVSVPFLLPDGSESLSNEEQFNALATELALRYNAKAAVMKVAEELGRGCRFADDMDFARMERLLRAAYEEKP